MITFLARLISSATNPLVTLFVAPYILLLLSGMIFSDVVKWTIYSFLYVFMTGVYIYYEVRKGVFTDFDVSRREQRPLLFRFATVMSLVYAISLYFFQAPIILYATAFGIMVGIILVSLINTQVKASIHVATNTAVILSFILIYELSIYLVLVIPVIAWSRIYLKRHSLDETLAGGILGVGLTAILYVLLKFVFNFTI